MADFITRIDDWMDGTVWTTRCNSYFRVANGRVVTQWPRSARMFWYMTRRFRAADYTFVPPQTEPSLHVRAHGSAEA
jgi:cyclohexanone monooxygenase